MDFVLLTSRPPSPKIRASAIDSIRSFWGVPVPWALAYPTAPGSTRALARAARIARIMPSPSGWGAVTWYASVVEPCPASSAHGRAQRARARAASGHDGLARTAQPERRAQHLGVGNGQHRAEGRGPRRGVILLRL